MSGAFDFGGGAVPAARPMPPRVLGRVDGGPGPLVIVVGGLHGNEPDGVLAAQQLLRELEANDVAVRGTLIALAGNRPALERDVRFTGCDLNRVWTDEHLDRIAEGGDTHLEDRELRELLMEFDRALDGHEGGTYLVDLHSTSSDGAPFMILGERCHAEAFATSLPLPMILGLQERLSGALTSWFDATYGSALVVEGGRSGEPDTVENHLGALWMLLAHAGLVDPRLAQVSLAEHRLTATSRGLPMRFQLVHVHRSLPGDGFKMGEREERRYRSFDPVKRGEVLGRDQDGVVESPADGWLLMPLYQEGEEGFFLLAEERGGRA